METIVFKIGGSTFQKIPAFFYKELVSSFQKGMVRPILVHGGGPTITEILKIFQIPTKFVQGIRYTDRETVKVVEMVLSGTMNKELVRAIISAGGNAIGISGVDAGLFHAVQSPQHEKVGLVGEVTSVNHALLDLLLDQGLIPVISPVSMDEQGNPLNINADQAAAKVAESFSCKLAFLSDIPGIMIHDGEKRRILSEVSSAELYRYINEGEITGGMIPKVESALTALDHGATQVVILDGSNPDALISILQGESKGTRIRKEEPEHVSTAHGNL